ncbi:MAG: DUF2283 domain-containing protein [Dehalococcoidia bacterium]|nr:DUF2283 domain-containing protein [Dehalococcoidia bacterium]
MADIEVHHDKGTATLVIWFGDPNAEVDCEHAGGDVIVMLDANGKPLGIEVLEFHPGDGPLRVSLDQVDTGLPRARASA